MAQAILRQTGTTVDYTPSSAVVSGQVVVQGSLVGVANVAIAASAKGALIVQGVCDVVQAAEIITAGALVYWDADGDPYGGTAGTGAATATSTDNTLIGKAVALTTATTSTVSVLLDQ